MYRHYFPLMALTGYQRAMEAQLGYNSALKTA